MSTDCPYRDGDIPNNICLSVRECNVCRRINGIHEGCNHPFNTLTPVCDADRNTTNIDSNANRKIAQCVTCKKSGR